MILALGMSSTVSAHEPLFGVGPHTLFKEGIGVETQLETSANRISNTYEVAYGITPNLTMTANIPFVLKSSGNFYKFENLGGSRPGFGDISLRAKWRFLRIDSKGASDGFAVVGGVSLPTGATDGDLKLGSGSLDPMFALTYGHEGRRWYAWADVRYRLTTEANGINRGDFIAADVAVGVRPWRMTYEQPDLVVLLESGLRINTPSQQNGQIIENTGRQKINLGPTMLLSWKNIMFKAGVALPLWWSGATSFAEYSSGFTDQIETVVGIEYHF